MQADRQTGRQVRKAGTHTRTDTHLCLHTHSGRRTLRQAHSQAGMQRCRHADMKAIGGQVRQCRQAQQAGQAGPAGRQVRHAGGQADRQAGMCTTTYLKLCALTDSCTTATIHTCVHTLTHAHIQACTLACMHGYSLARTCARAVSGIALTDCHVNCSADGTCIHAYMRVRVRTCVRIPSAHAYSARGLNLFKAIMCAVELGHKILTCAQTCSTVTATVGTERGSSW